MDAHDAKILDRDRRLRRRFLWQLQLARKGPLGGLSGRSLRVEIDDISPLGAQTTDDDHALMLLRELVDKGLAMETDTRRRPSEAFTIDHLFYRITDAGSRLLREAAPKDPDIEDDRL